MATRRKGTRDSELPVNTEKFYNLKADTVPADRKFFHRLELLSIGSSERSSVAIRIREFDLISSILHV